jgi:hypothetical protein
MVPTLSPQQEFALELEARNVINAARKRPEDLAQVTTDMMRLNMQYKNIIQAATKYILELEVKAALDQPLPARNQNPIARISSICRKYLF